MGQNCEHLLGVIDELQEYGFQLQYHVQYSSRGENDKIKKV